MTSHKQKLTRQLQQQASRGVCRTSHHFTDPWLIKERREEREAREREEEAQKQREKARSEETTHSAEEGVAEKDAITNRSDTQMDTGGGRETVTSQLHPRDKKGHMTNIYLMDSDELTFFIYFMKDCEELYDKTNEHIKDKSTKECLWEKFANSHTI